MKKGKKKTMENNELQGRTYGAISEENGEWR